MNSMRNYISIALSAMLFFVVGCSKPNRDLFRWKPILKDADSITIALDRENAACSDPRRLISMIGQLDSIAGRHPEEQQLKSRVYYWRAKYYHRIQKKDSMLTYAAKARELADSVTYSYDIARIDLLVNTHINKSLATDLIRLQNVKNYADATGDSLLKSHADVMFAVLMSNLEQGDNEIEAYQRAATNYSRLGLKKLELWMKLNIGLHYINKNDTLCADSVLSELLNVTSLRMDPWFFNKLIFDIGILRKDFTCMRESAKMADQLGDKNMSSTSRWYESFFRYRDGDTIGGDSILKDLLHKLEDVDLFLQANILFDNSFRVEREGKNDSALLLTRRFIEKSETIVRTANHEEVLRIEDLERVRRYNDNLAQEKREERTLWLFVGMLLLLLSMTIYIVMQKKVGSERQRKLEADMEVARQTSIAEMNRRETTSICFEMTEKNKVLQSVLKSIEDMEHDGRITRNEARKLDSIISSHLNRQSDWEDFRKIYTMVSPGFTDNLRRTFPELTEGDLKMAVYIYAGMDTKQIANMLNIRPSSVKMNRHRLRERMHLAPHDNLEEILGKLAANRSD